MNEGGQLLSSLPLSIYNMIQTDFSCLADEVHEAQTKLCSALPAVRSSIWVPRLAGEFCPSTNPCPQKIPSLMVETQPLP